MTRITWIRKDNLERGGLGRIFHASDAVNAVVATVGSDRLVPDTDGAVRIGGVSSVLAFRRDLEDDVVALDFVPSAEILPIEGRVTSSCFLVKTPSDYFGGIEVLLRDYFRAVSRATVDE